MRAVSVRQPWAWAIIHGGKTVENRPWKTRHRGDLVIHASRARCDPADVDRLVREHGANLPNLPEPDEFQRGAIIGVVELVDCVRYEEVTADSPHFRWVNRDAYCWILRRPRPIEPVALRGRLMLFGVDDACVRPLIQEPGARRERRGKR